MKVYNKRHHRIVDGIDIMDLYTHVDMIEVYILYTYTKHYEISRKCLNCSRRRLEK